MSEIYIFKMRERLLKNRQEIYEQLAHFESEREALKQRVIELADAAQKEDLARLLDKLYQRGMEEIKETNLALDRIAEGTYGICQLCAKRIPIKRLRALPATRFCRKCAKEYEQTQNQRQHLRDEIVDDELLDEYRSLNDSNVSEARLKLPRDEGLIDLKEV